MDAFGGRGGRSYLRQRAVPAPDAIPPPPVQLLDAARFPTRPPPPSPATEPPRQLGKARAEQSPGFGALGSPAAKGGGSETHLRGLREPSNQQRVLGRGAGSGLSAEPRRGAWPGAGAGGRRGTPRRALQGAARPARLGSAPSARPPARARSLARSPQLGPPGLGAVRGARCSQPRDLQGSIVRPGGGGRGGEGEGSGCACAPTSVCEGVSGPVCTPGPRTWELDLGLPCCLASSSRPVSAALPPSGPGAVSLPARPYALCV